MYTRSRIKRSCVRKPITDNSDEETHTPFNNDSLRKTVFENNNQLIGELHFSNKYTSNEIPSTGTSNPKSIF